MNFSLRSIEGVNMNYLQEGKDSELQLVFAPGGFDPGIWNHQLRYFSSKYEVISFNPMKSRRSYGGEKEALEGILDQEEVENAVLVSNSLGNPLVQSFEDRENVISTVLTGPLNGFPKLTRTAYRFFWRTVKREPKLMKKIFFEPGTDYRVVKKFSDRLEEPDFDTFREFAKRDVRRPVKRSLVIHARQDRFSDRENARNLNTNLSIIERSGTFPFHEKPQEFNKALSDFLELVEQDVEKQRMIDSAEKNRSLMEFEKREVSVQ